jgi:hypothetical protein
LLFRPRSAFFGLLSRSILPWMWDREWAVALLSAISLRIPGGIEEDIPDDARPRPNRWGSSMRPVHRRAWIKPELRHARAALAKDRHGSRPRNAIAGLPRTPVGHRHLAPQRLVGVVDAAALSRMPPLRFVKVGVRLLRENSIDGLAFVEVPARINESISSVGGALRCGP